MSENRPNINLKLKLKSTDTSRFKTEKSAAQADKDAVGRLSAEATTSLTQISDPLNSDRKNTGLLRKVSVNDETQAAAMSPLSQGVVGSSMPADKKNETVKLKVVKAPSAHIGGPATRAPISLDTVPQPVKVAPAATSETAQQMSAATAKIPLPTLKTGGSLGGLNLNKQGSPDASGSTVAVSAPERTVPVDAPEASAPAMKPGIAPVTVKLPMPKPASVTSEAVPASAPQSPAPDAPGRTTATLKIRPVVGAKPATATGSASATLKITPAAPAAPAEAASPAAPAEAASPAAPAEAASPAAPAEAASPAAANGEPQLKQTGIKLSLKKEAAPAPAAESAPAVPAGAGTGQVVEAPQPGSSGLKLKVKEAGATVAAPQPPAPPEGVPASVKAASSNESAATIAVTPVAPAAPASAEKEADVMPEFDVEKEAEPDGIGMLQGICAIVGTVAMGAACYFVLMDFLKYI